MSDQTIFETVFTQKDVSTWVQFVPGADKFFLGHCVNLDNLPRPKHGGKEYLYCWDPYRRGFQVKGSKLSAPGKTEFTISHFLEAQRSWLQQVECDFALYAMMTKTGMAETFGDWEAGAAVASVNIREDSITNVASANEDNELMYEAQAEAPPNRTDLHRSRAVAVAHPATLGITASAVYVGPPCTSGYGWALYGPSYKRVLAETPDTGLPAHVYYSVDAGNSWTDTSAQPFGNDIAINQVAYFYLNKSTDRIIAFADTQVGVAMQLAYSDDSGASWTTVTLGATLTEYPLADARVFIVESSINMYVASQDGNIYRSTDAGATWSALASALAITAGGPITSLSVNGRFVAFGMGSGVVGWAYDGENFGAAPAAVAAGAQDVTALEVFDEYRMIVGLDAPDSGSSIYITFDGGATWVLRDFYQADTYGVSWMDYLNDFVGYLVDDNGLVHMTVDGGREWEEVPVAAGAGDPLRIHVTGVVDGMITGATDHWSIIER